MPDLKPGKTVKIYQKPLTLEEFEGEAKLIKFIRKDAVAEDWLVEFPDGSQVERAISTTNTFLVCEDGGSR